MKYKNEESILKIIKYTPPIFILLLSMIVTLFLYLDFKNFFEEEKEKIETQFIEENKLFIKSHVERIYDYINNQYALTESKLKKELQQRVYEAHAIATRIYNENKASKSQLEIKKMIQDALVDIRFNEGRGYFYVYSLDYECILLPIARQFEGKSFYNFKEGGGRYLTREIITQVKKEKEGFKSWHYHKPGDMKKQYPKLGFNKLFEPYNWFIGTGEYIDDFENDIKADVLKYINTINLDNNGYIFTFDKEGTYLTYFNKDMIGKNIIEVGDSIEVNNVFAQMKEATQGGNEGYISYIHKDKPNIEGNSEKISFVKGVNYWGWIIGSGFYTDDAKEEIEELQKHLNNELTIAMKNLILISLILTISLLAASIYVSKLFRRRFYLYKQEIKVHIEEREKQQNLLAQQSKMAAMGEMIGNIAHQWRQPLSAITTASTGMKFQKDMDSLSDKDFDDAVNHINQSAQHLSQTIDDFRNFFKPDKESSCFYVKCSIEKTLKLIEAQFKNKDIEVHMDIEDVELCNLENEFIQVLLNILNNSRDQLILQDKEKDRLIFIKSECRKKNVTITIKDNAGGFTEDILPRIFEPYFTTKEKNQGTGIGLYMSKEIIEKHMKGKITASNAIINHNNKIYKGAQITITLTI